ncbi:MAG: VirD4-like conjugal transfer protein, CD1115 family [Bacilli bacterium]
MKLKFRADSKDFLTFIIFSIFLFYLVSIIVINAVAFVGNNTLPGFNPILVFTKEYLPPVMVIYIAIMIVIISSVSSYFFDREKGIGVSTKSKREKGYSNWSSEKDMKKEKDLVKIAPFDKTSEAAGIPIMNNGKEIWVDNGEFHSIIIGSTGSGKTEMLVQPMVKVLAKKGESMIITDPKGEIYEKNAIELKEKGYNIVLLNFREPQKGNCWNPLTLPYSLYKSGDPDKSNELLDDLAKNILYDESSKGQDPFWENTSADYFSGLSLALFDDAEEDEINLNTINVMTTVGEEKLGATNYMKEYFSDKSQISPAYINVASTLMAPADTKGSILSVFKQKIKLFSSRENLSEMLSHSDFNMEDIGRNKTAVFIVIQDEKKTYHSLVTIFLKQCYETLIRVAQENGGKLSYKTNFILDEFANMPPLKDVTTMVTAARSRKIRFNFIIQNFAQLNQVYGKENAETIKGNCGNIIYLISSELAALEEISKMCGEVKSKKDDKTASTPLITVSDLQRMKFGSMILLRTRCMPFKTELMPNYKMVKDNLWGNDYPLADYPQREKMPVPIFDIKKVVDEKRQNKINEMLSNSGISQSGPSFPVMSSNIPNFGSNNPFTPDKMFENKSTNSNKMNDINVDELVKRIDAKIAELEEEELREKEAKEKQQKEVRENNKKVQIEECIKEKLVNKEKPNIEIKKENKKITDDQFFDDFFSDD